MNRSLKETMKKLLVLACAGILAIAVSACTTSSSSFSMYSKMNNTIEINASNSGTDTSSDGSIQVGNAEVLVVEAALTSGKLNIRVLADGKEESAAADAEQAFSGNDTAELTVPRGGEYKVFCNVLEEGTSGSMKIYTKAAETKAAAETTAAEETTAATETSAAEETTAAEETSADEPEREASAEDGSDGNLEVADDSEDGIPPLREAAIAVDDLMVQEWSELRDVSYTLEENSIYVSLWADGINNETIDDVSNWEEVQNAFDDFAEECADILKNAGVENGHVWLYLVSDTTDDVYLAYKDNREVWDYFDNKGKSVAHLDGDSGGYLVMSEEEQKSVIADWVGCDAENLEYDGDGTFNDTESVAIYSFIDEGGSEADIRLLLFDDGDIVGFTPDNEVIDVEGYFAQ